MLFSLLDLFLWVTVVVLAFDAGRRRERTRYLYALLDQIDELEEKNVDLELREFARERDGNWWVQCTGPADHVIDKFCKL
jgi:hypothetical protein